MQWFRKHLTFANVTSLCALFVALGGVSYAALKLPRNSVGSKQIKAQAVKAGKSRSGAVTAAKLAPNSVDGGKVGDGTIGSGDLTDGGIGLIDLGPNSVNGAKVADGGIGLADLSPDSVDGAKVVNGSVGVDDLGANSVNGDKVEDASLAYEDAAAGSFLHGNVTVQYEIAAGHLAVNTSASYDVLCPAGQIAIGGGSRGDTTDSEYTRTTSSRPLRTGGGFPTDNQTFNGWRATVFNRGDPDGGAAGFPANPPDGNIQPEVWVICVGPTPPGP